MEVNNKLREALARILGIADHLQTRFEIPKLANQEISELKQIAEAALAEPVKNCEVGTAEQQAKRFEEYCESEVCKRNRCKSRAKALCIERCALEWAQKPYVEKEGGAK